MSYLRHPSTRQTSQLEPIHGSTQVKNSAGGYAWPVDDWQRLRRFLILGSEGGTYYAQEHAATLDNTTALLRCLDTEWVATINEIAAISEAGRAPRNDEAIYALALAAAHHNPQVRSYALDKLSYVCRTGTHLLLFLSIVEQHRGWGRGLRRAIANWYTNRTPDSTAYQVVKYRQRYRWTHRDALRLAKPRPPRGSQMDTVLRWTVGKPVDVNVAPDAIRAYETVARGDEPIATTIRRFGSALPREAVPPDRLTPAAWEALLDTGMPMTALLRNLATMTRAGVLTPNSAATGHAIAQLTDAERLTRARVHPVTVLAALLTYAAGRGARDPSKTWAPVAQIVDALDAAFYTALGAVEPTGQRFMIALDVSSSMDWSTIAGVPGLSPRVASAALAMSILASGDPCETVAFSHGLTPVPLSRRQRLDDVIRTVGKMPMGATDCALPMLYAKETRREVDVFVVLTDSETWAGRPHPAQALREYREASGIQARLAVVAMVSNGFTIADPQDRGMLDVVGFDTATPGLLSAFARGNV